MRCKRSHIAALVAAAAAAAAVIAVSAGAAEARVSAAPSGQPAQVALDVVGQLGDQGYELDGALLGGGLGTYTPTFVLVDASPASQRQALAHALGCWWMRAAGSEGAHRIVFTRAGSVATGKVSARTHPCSLHGSPGLEAVASRLLAPWTPRDGGVAYDGDEGCWYATLDPAGDARLVEVLSLFERPEPRCPSLIGDADEFDAARILARPVTAKSWPELAEPLARAAGISVSIDPDMQGRPFAQELHIAACALADLPARIVDLGAHARWLHGVLCIGLDQPTEREHPASRSRLALFPIAYLVADDVEGELLATTLVQRVASLSWNLPGWNLSYLTHGRALLAVADTPTLHALTDALAHIDQLGLEPGLAALKTETPTLEAR